MISNFAKRTNNFSKLDEKYRKFILLEKKKMLTVGILFDVYYYKFYYCERQQNFNLYYFY